MDYKTLLVHVETAPESELRLQATVEFARTFGAKLIGVGGCEPIYIDDPWIEAYPDGPTLQLLEDQECADLKQAKARFLELAASLGKAAEWRGRREYPDSALQTCAAAADLVVTGARRGPRRSTAAVADVIMKAGGPVLMLPDDLPSIRAKHVLIAWKNTREARRAIWDALPLLERADEVTLVAVNERPAACRDDSSLSDVVGRLARHGVPARTHTIDKLDGDGVYALTTYAETQLADLIVAGAYGHSRLREWALGGMTQGLIECSTLPVVFSH